MVKNCVDYVEFVINGEELIESIALLKDMHDYLLGLDDQEGKAETTKAVKTAVEVMSAYWCEKFGDDARG